MGLFLFNSAHLYASAFVALGFFVLGFFFVSVARVKPEKEVVKYRRWLRWRVVSYTEIRECGESWVYGYIRLRQYAFPFGRIYFLRPHSSDSLFGWDKEIISTIRARAQIAA
jgi:hypothetical protein